MIEGVKVKELKRIPDERGAIMPMLRNDDPLFESFGEIYFSKIYPGVIKGWHLHRKMTLNYAVVTGKIKLVLYDDRPGSKTKGELNEIFIGDENYCLVRIPPGIWNGFKCVSTGEAVVANCSTIPHDPADIIRKAPFSKDIPYKWELIHK